LFTIEVLYLHHVLVTQQRSYSGLVDEEITKILVMGMLRKNDLDRNSWSHTCQTLSAAFEYASHTSGRDRSHQSVSAQLPRGAIWISAAIVEVCQVPVDPSLKCNDS